MKTTEITVTQTYAITTEDDIDIETIVDTINRKIKKGEGWMSALCAELDEEDTISEPYDTELEVMW